MSLGCRNQNGWTAKSRCQSNFGILGPDLTRPSRKRKHGGRVDLDPYSTHFSLSGEGGADEAEGDECGDEDDLI